MSVVVAHWCVIRFVCRFVVTVGLIEVRIRVGLVDVVVYLSDGLV